MTNRAAPVLSLRCVSDGAFSTARIRPQGVRLLCAADTSAAASPSAPPFNVWADRWLAAADIAETTRLDYQTTIDYAKKTFDGKLVRNLTVSDIFRHKLRQSRPRTRAAGQLQVAASAARALRPENNDGHLRPPRGGNQESRRDIARRGVQGLVCAFLTHPPNSGADTDNEKTPTPGVFFMGPARFERATDGL